MPGALLDSCFVIDYLKGRPEAMTALNDLRAGGSVLLHSVVEAEIIAGALDARDLRGAQRFFKTCTSVVPDESDVRRSLVLFARHALPDGVDWHDCLIAATSLRLNLRVVTCNTKHFRVFRTLKVVRPY